MPGLLFILGIHKHCLELRGHIRDHRSAYPGVHGFYPGRLLLDVWERSAQGREDCRAYRCRLVSCGLQNALISATCDILCLPVWGRAPRLISTGARVKLRSLTNMVLPLLPKA